MGRIDVVIYAVPEREKDVARIKLALRGATDFPVRVVWDEKHLGAPWNELRAWGLSFPALCSHRLVLEDDVDFPPRFFEHLSQAVAARPLDVLNLHVPRETMYGAARAGVPFVRLSTFRWTQGVVMPKAKADELAAWGRERWRAYPKNAPDCLIDDWLKGSGGWAYATAPALVQHDGWDRSVLGHPASVKRSSRCVVDENLPVSYWSSKLYVSEQ